MVDFTLAFDQTGVLKNVKFSGGDEVATDAIIAQPQTEVAWAQLALAEQEATTEVNEEFARASCRVAEIQLEKALEGSEQMAGAVPLIEAELLRLAFTRAKLQIHQSVDEMVWRSFASTKSTPGRRLRFKRGNAGVQVGR